MEWISENSPNEKFVNQSNVKCWKFYFENDNRGFGKKGLVNNFFKKRNGDNAIIIAAESENTEIVKLFIKKGS